MTEKKKNRGEKTWGEKTGKKNGKIMMKIVATNVVASRPNGDRLQHRPLVPILLVQTGIWLVLLTEISHPDLGALTAL